MFDDFPAFAHSISAREGGNTVCWKAMARKRTVDNNVTYWFPWKHPITRRRGLEFGVFDQTPPKISSSARPYGRRRSNFFPLQNYNSQSIGSAFQALPFASLQENTTQMSARPRGPRFSSVANAPAPTFSPFDIRLAVSDVPRSTPTTQSVAGGLRNPNIYNNLL